MGWDFNEYQFGKLLEHMKIQHMFDFKRLRKKNDLEFYDTVKLVNYLREKREKRREEGIGEDDDGEDGDNDESFEARVWGEIISLKDSTKYLKPYMKEDMFLTML